MKLVVDIIGKMLMQIKEGETRDYEKKSIHVTKTVNLLYFFKDLI